MGIFGSLFGGKKNKEEAKKEQDIFYAQQDEKMIKASEKAQETFKYFWREVYWEYRRIVPAHDLTLVKIPFEQQMAGSDEPVVEHMWINQIQFNGDVVSGILMNKPNALTNVAEGDQVSQELSKISDWMFATEGKTYGGFTIHALRSNMSEEEREHHDSAWGLDFGDYNAVQLVYEQEHNPENLVEHPMSINMGEKAREFFIENPEEITVVDENGLLMLHREAIAGNKTTIEILLDLGADKNAKTNTGKTALDFAKNLGWEHIIPVLE